MNSSFLPALPRIDESSTAISLRRSKLALVQHLTPYSLLAQSLRSFFVGRFSSILSNQITVSPSRGHAQTCPKIRSYCAMISLI